MKTFRAAKAVMEDVAATRDDVTRAMDNLERASKTGLVVFVLVGIVASLALIYAVSKGDR
jgi:hypothetical protein